MNKQRFHDHTVDGIHQRLKTEPEQSYMRDLVYGGIDGAVTTFAVVTGVMGAKLSVMIILILGLANIFADGFSMAAANFLGTKTERDEIKYYEDLEKEHIKVTPEGEKQEVRQLYANKGFSGDMLEKIVDHITSDHQLWIKTMLREEYGLPAKIRSPVKSALCTFAAFMGCGAVALLPFVFSFSNAFIWSCSLVAIVFFAIGSLRSIWSVQSWWRSGLSTLAIGSIAASLAYLVGLFFSLHNV